LYAYQPVAGGAGKKWIKVIDKKRLLSISSKWIYPPIKTTFLVDYWFCGIDHTNCPISLLKFYYV